MFKLASRLLLSVSSVFLVLGAAFHGTAFKQAVQTIEGSNIPPYYGNCFKALWLADSTTLFVLAIVFTVIAARPALAKGFIMMLLAVIPAATAALLYIFLGANFFAGHILLAVAAMVFVAGLQHQRAIGANHRQ